MKHIFAPLALIASSFLLSSCFFNFKVHDRASVKPTGEMVSLNYEFPDVEQIRVDIPVDLEYTQTENLQTPGSVSVTIDKAYADYLDVTCTNGKLKIRLDGSIAVFSLDGASLIRVSSPYVTAVDLKGSSNVRFTNGLTVNEDLDVSLAGSGSVIGENFSVRDLDLNIAGSGDIRLESVTATNADINLAGSGNVNMPGLKLGTLEVNLAGSGNFEGTGDCDSVEISILGSGIADITGLAYDKIDTEVRGSGKIKK